MSKPIVSIARIKNDNIGTAVEEAIELLGGMESVTEGKERIMLKPNLVTDNPECTTNPEVVRMLAQLMKRREKRCLWVKVQGAQADSPRGKMGPAGRRTRRY